jgi:hypothetical protein
MREFWEGSLIALGAIAIIALGVWGVIKLTANSGNDKYRAVDAHPTIVGHVNGVDIEKFKDDGNVCYTTWRYGNSSISCIREAK